uniref:Alpha-amylase n=1 Tax=candidate division WOR-3 bacterium TaxID=2052148 RepID=A0A7C6EH80_UNCW3
MFEFHISKKCRDKYKFDKFLFQLNGNVVFTDISAVKKFADKWNSYRKKRGKDLISPAELNAMGLIDEILHLLIHRYQIEKNPDGFKKAFDYLNRKIGEKEVFDVIKEFVELFPPVSVYSKKETVAEYLSGKTDNIPNVLIALQEILMLGLANENPAFLQFKELFDDEKLRSETEYKKVIAEIEEFFKTQPVYGPYNQSLVELLKSPIRASPYSLVGQLLYIKEHWRLILSPELFDRLAGRILISLDFIREEKKERPPGPGPAIVPEFTLGAEVYADIHSDEPKFSPDTEWTPRVVMIAKHTYVWLYQLSKKYNREIKRLDEIPDEELKMLSDWGFNAIWLIGIWERSRASAKIKRLCGNPEAIASAYSIYDYEVAQELGGEVAFNNLKQRAFNYNIRIGVDMVPNHTALDSKWIKEHPDWFIQRDTSPFFNYRFSGPNLSEDPEIEIYIEDGYYNRTDAAVVFKLVDKRTKKIRYIYHGNDGTSTPWNDTAQLNFLLPEVREAVIQKIIHIAKRSPIIRLDAAMTLTKKHYQRLWFPEPGKGGDIPSRTEYSMTHNQFNKLFPKEFWREVVDRIAKEAPDTLLLAEAFWLMEGYFVRNLGMHRVYNSAFMNMLKMEQNKEYHQVLKNVLDYNPEILRRFVNFMSNPDELTAIQQFGKDDKYFGVCIMMATMPGLCMFGHGQVEGFQEKYGMEYRRSYWEEKPDEYLIKRHEREIFPLLKKRHLFSGVENFYLYDFYDIKGNVNENVFAYSNGNAAERMLVIYNNRYQEAQGWVRSSERFHTKNICTGLNLHCQEGIYYLCRENRDNLFYLIDPIILLKQGWFIKLGAYKYHIFMDFKELPDNQNKDFKRLFDFLNGSGFLNIDWVLSGMKMIQRIEDLKEIFEIKKSLTFESPLSSIIENIIKKPFELKNLILYTPIAGIIERGNSIFEDGIKLSEFFQSNEVKNFLMNHTYENIEWFNKERLELMLSLIITDFIFREIERSRKYSAEKYVDFFLKIHQILNASIISGYQFQKFLEHLTRG